MPADFDNTPIGRAFIAWKVAYGLAIHGNYTFALPNREVQKRWDDAINSEQSFVAMLTTISNLSSKLRHCWIYTIEAEIERLEKERKLALASGDMAVARGVGQIDQLLAEARKLLEEAIWPE